MRVVEVSEDKSVIENKTRDLSLTCKFPSCPITRPPPWSTKTKGTGKTSVRPPIFLEVTRVIEENFNSMGY